MLTEIAIMPLAMNNRFFSSDMLKVLLTPENWRFVSSHFPPDVPTARDKSRRNWSLENEDSHAHQELLIVLQGGGFFGYQGEVYPCEPGVIFFLDTNEKHDLLYPTVSPDVDHLWIHLFKDHLTTSLITIRDNSMRWSGLIRRVSDEDEGHCFLHAQFDKSVPDDVRKLWLSSSVGRLIAGIVRDSYSTKEGEDAESFQRKIISAIERHIEETAGRGVTLDNLARISGYSKYHFLRLFKKHTGISVHQYVDHMRLKKVHEMLKRGCYKSEIASALGFSCLSAFIRWHKRVRL